MSLPPNIRIKWAVDMKLLVICVALTVALFFYALRYLSTRDHLVAVCRFVGSEAAKLARFDAKSPPGLEDAFEACVDAEVVSAKDSP